MALLESRIAFIRDLAQRGGIGATLAARDAAMIVELALRELLRRYAKELPPEAQAKVEHAIAQQAKGGRGKTVGDFTLGQLVGVIRESRFFDLWADATGKPLITLRMINLDALNAFRNKHLTHVADFEQLTDPAAQVSPGTAQFLLHCVDELVKAFGIESLESLPPEPGPADIAQLPDIGHSPYVGLRPFEARHHDLFFGREQESEELHQQVLSQPFVALIGNSGSGKSSLLGAGLLPRLPAADWCVISLQPRNDLFDSLAASLVPVLYPDPAEQAAQRDKLARLLAEPDYRLDHLLRSLADQRRVLLLVDQFEEVFTLSADRPRQRRAVELQLTLLRGDAMTLLLSLRADYFGRCLDIDPLRQTLAHWPALTLGAMGEAALFAAITRPAERSGLSLEDGLAETIVEDLGDEPGQLPLLQTALDELWQRSDRRKLTHAGYRAIGGVAHALARKADEFLARYDDEGQDRLRRIFLQLIRPGEGEEDTRQLATESQVGAENWELVAQLASARLVVTGRMEQDSPSPNGNAVELRKPPFEKGGQGGLNLNSNWLNVDGSKSPLTPLFQRGGQIVGMAQASLESSLKTESVSTITVELAHEALIRHWQTLRDWIVEDRAFRLWQNKLRDSRAEWANHAQDDGYLLRGAKLLEAEERLAEKSGWLAEDEKAFIAASTALRHREAEEKERQRRERERLQKRVLHTIAAALVVALGLIGVAGWQWRTAEARKVQAEENFQKAKQAVDEFFTAVSENKLLNQPALEPLRKELLEKALRYYEELGKQRGDDEKTQAELAKAAFRVGEIKRLLGDTAGAEQAVRRTMDISERLAQSHPEEPEYLFYLASSHKGLGVLLKISGDSTGAREAFRKALEIHDRLAREHPDAQQYQSALAADYVNLCSQLVHSGDSAGAWEACHKALAIYGHLTRENPDLPQYQSDLTTYLNYLGFLLSANDESAGAAQIYLSALEIQERLAREHPDVPQYQAGLAAGYDFIGLFLLKKGSDNGWAREANRKALAIYERVAREHPDVPEYQIDLAKSYSISGLILRGTGDTEAGRESFRKALEIFERLTSQHPNVPEYQSDLVNAYNNLVAIQNNGGDLVGAKDLCRKALDIDDRLAREHPDIPLYRQDSALALANLAKVELLSRQFQAALGLAQQAVERDPGASWINTRLAHSLLFTGQYEQAAKLYLANPAEKLPIFGGKTFAEVVLEDFKQFRAKGITHPDMAKIEKLLRDAVPGKP